MSEHDDTATKMEAFLEVLDDLIGEMLAAGVPDVALRRTLLAHAVGLFKSRAAADGIAAMDHFRKALVSEFAPTTTGGSA